MSRILKLVLWCWQLKTSFSLALKHEALPSSLRWWLSVCLLGCLSASPQVEKAQIDDGADGEESASFRSTLETQSYLIETDLRNACGMATFSWPLCNIYGCWSVVCQWSEITPYLFSLRTLAVNPMSLCSPLGEMVISDVQTAEPYVPGRSQGYSSLCRFGHTGAMSGKLGACFLSNLNNVSWRSALCDALELRGKPQQQEESNRKQNIQTRKQLHPIEWSSWYRAEHHVSILSNQPQPHTVELSGGQGHWTHTFPTSEWNCSDFVYSETLRSIS